MKKNIRVIATEEHFESPFDDASFAQKNEQQRTEEAIKMGAKHIADMDAAGVDIQVLTPGSANRKYLVGKEDIDYTANTNRFLYEMVKHYPGRLEGFAIVPMSDPEAAADELVRAVTEYGFKGLQLNSNINGSYLDNPSLEPIFKQAAKLDIPIYLHPALPSKDLFNMLYASDSYSKELAGMMSRAGWGWHIETGLSLLRLVMSGLFDRYNTLQIMVGHMGEALPFMLPRIETRLSKQLTKLDRSVSEYLRGNVHYTFGGFNFLPTFINLYMQMGADRIIYSTDYPHADQIESVNFLHNLPICEADIHRIAYKNAEKLLKISQKS